MGYWQEVGDLFKKGVDLAVDNLKESADVISKKTKEGALIARVKTQVFIKERELQDIMADLGDAVFDLYKEQKDIYSDAKIKGIVEKAEKIINECKKLESELKKEEAEKPGTSSS
jgi:hypothetical protein